MRVRRLALCLILAAPVLAQAQTPTPGDAILQRDIGKAHIPDLFDRAHHLPKPDPGQVKTVRFLTTDDFPPFHFALPDGTLTGFDVDLARAVCKDLQLACTIQARRFDTLIAQIKEGKDDALIAAVANDARTRADLDFTAPYYTTPARFVVLATSQVGSPKAGSKIETMTPESLAGRKIGVEAGTAHEAYLRTFFSKSALKTYANQTALRDGLRKGEVEAIFGDGIGLAIWLNNAESKSCCVFRGGPFTQAAFFGNGVSIAVAKGNVALRQALDYELAKFAQDGTYTDLYLKYFPIGFY